MSKKTLKEILKALAFAAVYIAAKILSSNVGAKIANAVWQQNGARYTQISLFSELITIAIVLLFARFVLKRKASDFWLGSKGAAAAGISGYAVGALLFGTYMLIAVITKTSTYAGRGELSLIDTLIFIPAFAVQSFEEELLSRGVLQRVIKDKWGIAPSIILPSIFFVIMHLINGGINFFAIVNIFTVGVLFSLMVYATDSLWHAAAAHAAWNYMQGTFFGKKVSGNQFGDSFLKFTQSGDNKLISGDKFGPEGSMAVFFILALAAVTYYLLWRKKQRDSKLAEDN